MSATPSRSDDYNTAAQGAIACYQLDLLYNGGSHCYIWRHHPTGSIGREKTALLVDLNNMYIPENEIEKMVLGFVLPAGGVSIAFANCHAHNQQEIKRRLKACDVALYSKTAFFADTLKARQWLKARSLNH